MKPVTVAIYVIVGLAILGVGINFMHAGDRGWTPWFAVAVGGYFLLRAYFVSRTPKAKP